MNYMKSTYLALGICLACQAPQIFYTYVLADENKTGSIKRTEATQKDLTVEEELAKTKADILTKRPYKLEPENLKEITVILIKPTSLAGQVAPDWWSEKQAYDISKLYGLALAKYPGIKVQLSETWEDKILREESPKNIDLVADQGSQTRVAKLAAKPLIHASARMELVAELKIIDYSFQYMPVRRRGVGLGFIALNSKECTTETFLKSETSVAKGLSPGAASIKIGMNSIEEISSQTVAQSRMILERSGGTSLNFNFLLGGAGGGNFLPPDKPLKRIIYETVVDAAEATYCLTTNQEECLRYYKNLPVIQPSKLTKKQRKKVGGC